MNVPDTTPAGGPETCPSYLMCSAPICPLDAEDLATWYPGEAVCRRQWKGAMPRWLRLQRRFSRRARHGETYFTRAMFEAATAMGSRAVGVDPDGRDPEGAEATWIRRRQRRRPAVPPGTLDSTSKTRAPSRVPGFLAPT